MSWTLREILDHVTKIKADERERCARLCEQYAADSARGGPMSSIAEDTWGEVHALELAKMIRELK